MAHPSVVFVTALYHGPDELTRLLASLEAQTSDDWRLIVVDNGSTDDEAAAVDALVKDHRAVTMVSPHDNLGYFGAMSRARRDVAELREGDFEWFVITNQDLDIDPAFVAELVACDPAEAAIVAPRVTALPSGRESNPYMRTRPPLYMTAKRAASFATLAGIRAMAVRAERNQTAPAPTEHRIESIYAAHGSLMALHRRFFEAGGTTDWDAFLFGEEIFVAEQARRLGLIAQYRPALRAIHYEHTSTGVHTKVMLRYKRQGMLRSCSLLVKNSLNRSR